jgi:CBS domain-containing protein
MSRYVEVVAHDSDVKAAAMKMRDLKVAILPVCDGPVLTGIVTIRDIALRLAAEGHDASLTHVGEIMTRGPIYCFEDDYIEEAARAMESYDIDRLPVLDRKQRLVGIVAVRDIQLALRRERSAVPVPEIAVLASREPAARVAGLR